MSNILKCEVCGQSILDTPLYRNGPKGQKVSWRCVFHLDPEWAPNKGVVSLAELIASDGKVPQ